MSKKLKNAISIKTRAYFLSPSAELILVITLLFGLGFAFWTEISAMIFKMDYVGGINDFSRQIAIMILSTAVVLLSTMMIVRIGMQVGFEKGNKISEIILTSLTSSELFVSHFVSGLIIMVTVIVTVTVPIAMTIVFKLGMAVVFENTKLLQVGFAFLHTLLVFAVYVLTGIAAASKVKRIEDTGQYMAFLMLPNIVSQVFFVINGSVYSGKFVFCNFIPYVTLITGVGASLNGSLGNGDMVFMLSGDLLFCGLCAVVCKKIYIKNISIK